MEYDDTEYLEHHGILGQKWGVRRYQNRDGTRTAAGKRRERNDYEPTQNYQKSRPRINKKKLAVAGVAAGVTIAGALALANPTTRKALMKYGKIAISKMPGAMEKAGTLAGKATAKGVNALQASSKRVSNAMLDAALMSVGTVQIARLEDRMRLPDDASQAEKDRNKILFDTAKAGIQSATNPKGYSSSGRNKGNSNGGGKVGKDVTDRLGPPSKRGVDKQSPEWGDLFKGVSDPDQRATIKTLAGNGYDIDQLQEYKRQFVHSEIDDWILNSGVGDYIVN